ncbi:heavy metal translocating P-type ATPase [Haloplasma contractile]|uniref:Heavy metal-transporting ATPase protein n=1 Tax=Haloplasma contractile SSD-17B TaxID=1033810 RepID=U2EAF4_9MOLU|nr:heavy metal translocating P-type ATPase [Haloplasma contractile]ERJ12078.1 Heavy metal-transporting ATPase protein [Haloplasma contractile SSD-17B]
MSERKKIFEVDNLSCANCAQKIEDKIKQQIKVDHVHVNFVTKQIQVEYSNSINTQDLFVQIKKVVEEVEGSTAVCELVSKKQDQSSKYAVIGLDCANCATKIEQTLNNTDGIKKANLDFVSKTLSYTLKENQNKIKMHDKIAKLVDDIEPGVRLKLIDHTNEAVEEQGLKISQHIPLILGALIFISILFVDKTSVLYIPMFIISYLLIGGEIVFRAIKNLFRGKVFDENFLMTVATIGAFGIEEYPEAVAVMLFYQVGELFQGMAVNRSRRNIKKLMSIKPDVANLKTDTGLRNVPVEYVEIDSIVVVKPGEKVPLDGVIIEGESTLDTKALTGESLPVEVSTDEEVLSGTINLTGLITVRVTKTSEESTVSKVLELVQNASSKKAQTENFITKFARVYTPIVTISALLLALIPPLLVEGQSYSDWLSRAFVFLVISCPCALVVSIPLGFFGGIGSASKHGILVKGGNYLEALNNIKIAVFDKTGTLTKGEFAVKQVQPTSQSFTELQILEIAAHVESFSNHPIARSVLNAYENEINEQAIEEVEEISGHGLKAIYKDNQIVIGNARLMNRESIDIQVVEEVGSILYIAVNGEYIGYILVQDEIKNDSKHAIKQLKALGVNKTVMLTGDKRNVAELVGTELGIDEVYAELLPNDKLDQVEKLLKEKQKGNLFFVGDGINDTPVLARADIGIAMGGLGADAAIDVADVVIMTDEPSKIATGIKVAKKTRRIVWQNIVLALGVKLFVLALGALGEAGMWEAVFADVGVSVIAVLNAMRILRYRAR